ncbi:MAG: HEAT repeat domain-containing protein [Acidobacteria bacterium]|nr:HEAT repeat domain-containing protein [Acidobacteriota bacterium]
MKDFYISYSKADHDWAEWIAWQLEDAGFTTTIQAWDFRPGSNFVLDMHHAAATAERTIAVLSPDYLQSLYTQPEWAAAFAQDPTSVYKKLLPIRVRDCKLNGLLAQIVYIDLANMDEASAKEALLAGVNPERAKPSTPPGFPGSAPWAVSPQPRFPGASTIRPQDIHELLAVYCQRLEQRVSTVRLFGGEQLHPLDQVFVELTINEEHGRSLNQAELLGLMDAELRRMRSVFGDADQSHAHEVQNSRSDEATAFAKTKRTIKPDDLLRNNTHAVVVGAPGCGKTTLLHYLAWQTLKQRINAASVSEQADYRICNSTKGKSKVRRIREFFTTLKQRINTTNSSEIMGHHAACLPVFLDLKQLTVTAFQQSQGQLEELLFAQAIAATLKPEEAELAALKQYFFSLLRAGRVAIFLDGLDEVSGASFFRNLQKAVSEFLHSVFGGNTVIVSTRPYALRRLGDAHVMEILPLSPRQIEQFVAHYYRDLPERQQFHRELQRRRELRELARVPALLGFILQLWRDHGNVSDDKLQLYEQITLKLARQLDNDKEGVLPERKWLATDPDGSLKRDFLRQLAFNSLFKGIVNISENITADIDRLVFTSDTLCDEAVRFTARIREREGTQINPRSLVEDAKATVLLRQVGADQYAFAHLTLQEYLAAVELAEREDCEQIFCRAYFDPMLSKMEVLPMTLAIFRRPDDLYNAIERLPESLTFTNLRLCTRGLGYGARVSHDKSTILLDRLLEIIIKPSYEEQFCRRALLKTLWFLTSNSREYLEEKVVQYLSETSSFKNLYAAEALVILGSEKSFDPLVKALNPNPPSDRFISRVIGYSHVNESFVNYICRALVRIVPQRAIPILTSIHTHYSYGEIDRLLKQIGTEDAFMALLHRNTKSSFGEISRAANELLKQCETKGVVDVLVDALKHDRDYIRELAVETLGHIGLEEHVEQMVKLLRDPGFAVRWKTARALEEIASEKAIEPLLEALQDKDSTVRWCSASALGATRSEKAVQGLINALSDSNLDVQYHAASALGWIGSEQGVDSLISVLNGRSWSKPRIAAAYALYKIRSIKAVTPLIQCLTDTDSEVRAGAVFALGGVYSEEAVEALLKCLSDNSIEVRKNAILALGMLGSERAIPHLLQILRSDSNHLVRESLIEALASIGTEEVIGPLLEACSFWFFTFDAEKILARINTNTLALALPGLLQHENSAVRRKASQIIGYYCHGLDVLHGLASTAEADPDENVRRNAHEALRKFESKLQYFEIPIPSTSSDDHPESNPP